MELKQLNTSIQILMTELGTVFCLGNESRRRKTFGREEEARGGKETKGS